MFGSNSFAQESTLNHYSDMGHEIEHNLPLDIDQFITGPDNFINKHNENSLEFESIMLTPPKLTTGYYTEVTPKIDVGKSLCVSRFNMDDIHNKYQTI